MSTVSQRPDGRVVACGFRPEPGPEETGFDDHPTDDFQGWLERFLAQRIRGLDPRAPPPVERRFASTCGFSSDGLPLLGALPGQPEVVAACGYTMRGLSFGAAAGRAVARLILHGTREFPACLAASRML